jgi:hypothetical protein
MPGNHGEARDLMDADLVQAVEGARRADSPEGLAPVSRQSAPD